MWTLHKAIKEPNALTFAVTHNVDTRLNKPNKHIPITNTQLRKHASVFSHAFRMSDLELLIMVVKKGRASYSHMVISDPRIADKWVMAIKKGSGCEKTSGSGQKMSSC
jgi:hypothetical protein